MAVGTRTSVFGVVESLKSGCDNSPKGSIDGPIVGMCTILNEDPRFYTTSSCSGRISLFASASQACKGSSGHWLLSSHVPISGTSLMSPLASFMEDVQVRNVADPESVDLKHEPAIIHVRCIDLDSAKSLLHVALKAGFRESGIVLGKKKVMLAIRTTSNVLEVPVMKNGNILVPDAFLSALCDIANRKFAANMERLTRLEQHVRAWLASAGTIVNSQQPPRTQSQFTLPRPSSSANPPLFKFYPAQAAQVGASPNSALIRLWGASSTSVSGGTPFDSGLHPGPLSNC